MISVKNNIIYCNSFFEYSRFKTREVMVGDLGIGGDNPIRIQSMTTTDTMDTIKTVEQSIRMIKAGCELVRITTPSINESKNLENIKKELNNRGYNTPICADIHFTPNVAETAARIVEKVRVNPGNYTDKKKFKHIDYSDKNYDEEIEKIRESFLPLIKICKEYGTAMRIGTNHGSLSDRILSRYGDTPLGMVESAMEFVRICEEEKYFSIVLSMKASNPLVMVQAYRLLVHNMMKTGRNYPLHLGVTEAGDGKDGRIKSAVGIGTLLEDGLGDTIRISLTEEPEFEIPVAKNLIERYFKRTNHKAIIDLESKVKDLRFSPFEYSRRKTNSVVNIGGQNVPCVIADFSCVEQNNILFCMNHVGYSYSKKLNKWNFAEQACDYIYLGDTDIDLEIPKTLGLIYNSRIFTKIKNKTRVYPLFYGNEYFENKKNGTISNELNFIVVDLETICCSSFNIRHLDETVVLVFETNNEHGMAEQRRMFFELLKENCTVPVIIKRNYIDLPEEKFQLYSSTDIGALLIDGFGDGVWIKCTTNHKLINSTAFGILQATRTRISQTEYISCPSCGRTLFNLQETTAKIRAHTFHLKGIKIGIMGCIVNGPGEMADADYGYVGTGAGKITLYKGKEIVKKNIPVNIAVDELIMLIKENNDWIEK
ncbi:MAG: (E)-4-hydroxy-3-methylbut-2-enyl-diphosphate synthase [Bacteroidota bacterium]